MCYRHIQTTIVSVSTGRQFVCVNQSLGFLYIEMILLEKHIKIWKHSFWIWAYSNQTDIWFVESVKIKWLIFMMMVMMMMVVVFCMICATLIEYWINKCCFQWFFQWLWLIICINACMPPLLCFFGCLLAVYFWPPLVVS